MGGWELKLNLEKLIEKFSSGGNKPEKSIGVSVEEAMSLRIKGE